jgi:hypothetical protein
VISGGSGMSGAIMLPAPPIAPVPSPLVSPGLPFLGGLGPLRGAGQSPLSLPPAASGIEFQGPITYSGPIIPETMLRSDPLARLQLRTEGNVLYFGSEARMIRTGGGVWLPGWYPGQQSGELTTYSALAAPNMLVDVPGRVRHGIVQATAFGGAQHFGRGYPMPTSDLILSGTSYQGARSHIVPHADTQPAAPGGILSTSHLENYMAHPQRYNTRVRRTLEGRKSPGHHRQFHRAGSRVHH